MTPIHKQLKIYYETRTTAYVFLRTSENAALFEHEHIRSIVFSEFHYIACCFQEMKAEDTTTKIFNILNA